MDETKKRHDDDDHADDDADDAVRRAQNPTRDDVHEQRVPDQAAEGTTERQDPETERKRPPTVDETGGR